jgi:uncharacterized protein YbaA (DUF1428 family)
MTYVDGFVLPVPKRKMAAYKKMAETARDVWLEHGALDYREAVADDVQKGKVTSFPQAVKLKTGEAVVFSYVTYKSRAERDRVMKKVMADPRLSMNEPSSMPFDGARMFWGGFETIVEANGAKAGARRAKPRRAAAKRATAKRGAAKRGTARTAAKRGGATRRTATRTAAQRTSGRRTTAKRAPMKRAAPKRTGAKRTMRRAARR